MKDRPINASHKQKRGTPVGIVPPHILRGKRSAIQRMMARRAYELFERRGRMPGHQMDDWAQAETELLYPCCVDLKESAEAIILRADLPGSFTADQLRVSVETRQVMIGGERKISVICGHCVKHTQHIRRRALNESFECMTYRRMWIPPGQPPLSWAVQLRFGCRKYLRPGSVQPRRHP
jgi:HSP20 family molecular chaperone IbpA